MNKQNKNNKMSKESINKVVSGINDLETVNPKLAKEWHPTKNGTLTPRDVSVDSNRKVWWIYPYDNPATGEHLDYEWAHR